MDKRKIFEQKVLKYISLFDGKDMSLSPREDLPDLINFCAFLLKSYKLTRAYGTENLQRQLRELEDDYADNLIEFEKFRPMVFGEQAHD